MNRVALKHIALRSSPLLGLAPKVHRVLFGLFLLQFALVWTRLWLPWPLLGNARWPDGLLVVLTTATVLASLTRQLPGQNVMLAAIIIAFIGGAVQSLGALTAIPFGPYVYTDHIGQQLFYPLPWAVPLIWITIHPRLARGRAAHPASLAQNQHLRLPADRTHHCARSAAGPRAGTVRDTGEALLVLEPDQARASTGMARPGSTSSAGQSRRCSFSRSPPPRSSTRNRCRSRHRTMPLWSFGSCSISCSRLAPRFITSGRPWV